MVSYDYFLCLAIIFIRAAHQGFYGDDVAFFMPTNTWVPLAASSSCYSPLEGLGVWIVKAEGIAGLLTTSGNVSHPCVHTCLCLSPLQSACWFIGCLFVCLVCPSVDLPVRSVRRSICLCVVHLSLSVRLSVCLSYRPCVCPFSRSSCYRASETARRSKTTNQRLES